MIRAPLFLCAGSGSIDVRYNTISVFHIMEQVNAPQFPLPIAVSIAAMFTRDRTDPSVVQLQLQILSGEEQLFAGPVTVDFQFQNRARTLIEMQGLIIPAPRDVHFILRNGQDIIGTWTMTAIQVGAPAMQLNLPVPPARNQ